MTDASSYDVLADGMAHQLRRASQAVNAAWQRLSEDLTAPQFAVLQALDEQGRVDQKTLGGLAAIDRSTITPLLDRLQARGLITKTTDPDNRRRQLVALTAAGRDRAALGRQQAREAGRWIEELLGTAKLAELTDLLREIGDAGRTGA